MLAVKLCVRDAVRAAIILGGAGNLNRMRANIYGAEGVGSSNCLLLFLGKKREMGHAAWYACLSLTTLPCAWGRSIR